MKVVGVFGGLGSQMVKYAFYLGVKNKTKDTRWIIDTTFCDLCGNNGGKYVLDNIFGIKEERDLKNAIPVIDRERKKSMSEYRLYILKELSKLSAPLYWVIRGEVINYNSVVGRQYRMKEKIKLIAKAVLSEKMKDTLIKTHYKLDADFLDQSFYELDGNIYFDEFLHNSDKYLYLNREGYKKVFIFPTINDKRNNGIVNKMKEGNSVAIHVRRRDHLLDNGLLYKKGYYSSAVKYIKAKEEKVSFFIFSDDPEWCKKNLEIFDLGGEDDYSVIDWNEKEKSYIDMQLMTYCKHNILAISSFSWWSQYLSNRKNKIVCAPTGFWEDATNHF